MSKKLIVAIIGGVIALVVGFAANNGLITQETADEIKTQSDQILSEDGSTEPGTDAAIAPETSQEPEEPAASEATMPADDAAISIEPTEPAAEAEQTQ